METLLRLYGGHVRTGVKKNSMAPKVEGGQGGQEVRRRFPARNVSWTRTFEISGRLEQTANPLN